MHFQNIDWADSEIAKIEIEYNCAKLFVYNDTLQKNVIVNFAGFIGLTNLCMWDDQIIDYAEVRELKDDDSAEFTKMLFSAYNKYTDYGERCLGDGIFEVRIRLINQITFSIYCQSIEVEDN